MCKNNSWIIVSGGDLNAIIGDKVINSIGKELIKICSTLKFFFVYNLTKIHASRLAEKGFRLAVTSQYVSQLIPVRRIEFFFLDF